MILSPARLLLGVSAAAILLASGCQPLSESSTRSSSSSDAPANSNASVSVSVTSGNTVTSPAAMSPVPAAVFGTEIKTLDGKSVRLSDYAGKVVILDLWATWCPPCRKEIPHLIELGNEYKSRGVEVIGITMEDPQADLKKVQDFIKEFNINYKVGWATREMALGILEMSGRDTIPQTLIITRDGRVIKHIVGFNPIRTPDSMREALEQAVKL